MAIPSARAVLWVTLAAAVAVFCLVQDRVTAAGARRYVALQTAALAGRHASDYSSAVTVEEIMRPAIRSSVRLGLLAGGGVAAAGLAAAALVRRGGRRVETGSGPVS